MNPNYKTMLLATLAISAVVGNLFSDEPTLRPIKESGERARVMVLADMGHDPDEEQQIVHLFMCSNEFEIEGLIAVTGRYFRNDPNLIVKDLRPHLFHQIIDGYETILPNLKLHASGWLDADDLRKVVARGQEGNGIPDTGNEKSSAGSDLIVAGLKKDDARPLNIVINSGANTLAQALIDLRNESSAEELDRLAAKLRVFDNGGQDEAGAWICHEFPNILYVRSVNLTKAFGGPSNRNLGPHVWMPYEYSPAGQHAWAKKQIQTNHGALGAVYPDRFVGMMHYMEGGGTVPFMGFASRGLSYSEKPYWGGWSGRFSREKLQNVPSYHRGVKEDEKIYRPYAAFSDHVNVKDSWIDPDTGKAHCDVYTTVWRWRRAMWNDLQCRMDWCVETYGKANHHPKAIVNGDDSDAILTVDLKAGTVLSLDANDSMDPDGDQLKYSWFMYPEAGTCTETVNLSTPHEAKTKLSLPENSEGREIHIILEVSDDHQLGSLSDYRRIVITLH